MKCLDSTNRKSLLKYVKTLNTYLISFKIQLDYKIRLLEKKSLIKKNNNNKTARYDYLIKIKRFISSRVMIAFMCHSCCGFMPV